MKTVIRDIFLKYMLNIQKNYLIQKERKSENAKSLFATYESKKTMLF